MAKLNCSACEELRQTDPNLIVNGLGDTEVASLKNDTGLVASSGNNDCTDLNNLNDCLVGGMETEVNAYDVCDWKAFMKRYIPNTWTVGKALISAICGIWANIHSLWTLSNRIDCLVDSLYNGKEIKVGEDPTSNSYVVAGKGVSFYETGQTDLSGDVTMQSFGGMGLWSGSVIIHHSDFTDSKACANLDLDSGTPNRVTSARKGWSGWGEKGKPPGGSALLYEVRIKASAFPYVGALSAGRGINANGGAFHCMYNIFRGGQYAHGLYGLCHPTSGTPADANSSAGHLVPNGWIYFQCRMTYLDTALQDGHQYSPKGWFGIKLNRDEITC